MLAVFTGSVVDRLGPKKGLLFGVACLGFMSLLFGFSPSYPVLLTLAVFAGLGFSIITPSVNKGVMIETPPGKRAISMGIMQSGVGVGGFAGASLLPLLGEYFGWRITIQLTGLFILVIGFLAYKFYHEKTGNITQDENQNSSSGKALSFKENLSYFLTKMPFVILCIYGALLAGSTVGAVLSHFPVYLSEDLFMSRAASGLGLGIFQIGGMIGRPGWGWLSDKLFQGNWRKTIFLIGFTGGSMFVLFGLFISGPDIPLPVIYLFSFLLGLTAFGWFGVFFIAVGEIAGEASTGGATGLALLFTRVGILITPPLFGLVADISSSYSSSWLLFGVIILAASLLYNFTKHSKP